MAENVNFAPAPNEIARAKKLSRILKLKQSSHVTIIQSRWRGRMARIMRMKQEEQKKIVPVETDAAPHMKLRRSGTTYNMVQKSFMRTRATVVLNQIQIGNIKTVEFCVDGASGLPYSSTVTRITARMMVENKTQIGETSPAAFSHPDSDYTSPAFDLHMGWRGALLSPIITIICRIDTLESPSLEPKCVGYSALRLCVDEHGRQPTTENMKNNGDGPEVSNEYYLNAGHYLLPVYYGRVPKNKGPLSQALIESMPPIEGAYLSVRLFDANGERNSALITCPKSPNETPLPIAMQAIMPAHPFTIDYELPLSKRSVACVLIHTMSKLLATERINMLPIAKSIVADILANKLLDRAERIVLTKQLTSHFPTLFPDINTMKLTIDARYMLKYEHNTGAVLALDMLYNMPMRVKLIKAAQTSSNLLAIEQGLARGFDNKINMFKTVFRYLPGAEPPHEKKMATNKTFLAQQQRLKSDANIMVSAPMLANRKQSMRSMRNMHTSSEADDIAENIFDDASVAVCLESHEASPYYADEFSCTSGLKLNPTACILVVVTAVDVLTNSEVDSIHNDEHDRFSVRAHNTQSTVISEKFDHTPTNAEIKERLAARDARNRKLKGLIGIHIGHNDRKATWWGLLPLHTENPLPFTPPEPVIPLPLTRTSLSAIAPYTGKDTHPHSSALFIDTHSSKLTLLQTGGSSVGSSVHTLMLSAVNSPVKKSFRARFPMLQETSGSDRDNNNDENNEGLIIKANFINAGTHQIPLFEGIPPDELIHSPDPFQWLINKLRAQSARDHHLAQRSSFFNNFVSFFSTGSISSPERRGSESNSSGRNSTRNSSRGFLASALSTFSTDSHDDNNNNDRFSSLPNSRANSRRKSTKSTKKNSNDLTLTQGASAMVRLADSRLRFLDTVPLIRDQTKPISDDTLRTVLRAVSSYTLSETTDILNSTKNNAYSPSKSLSTNNITNNEHLVDKRKYNNLCKTFMFNSLKHSETRTMRKAIPDNIVPSVLFEEINLKFDQSLFN